MNPADDPLADIYKMMDESGLNYADLMSSKKSGLLIVSDTRTKLAMLLKSYIVRRDQKTFNDAFNKGKNSVKRIEVQDEQ